MIIMSFPTVSLSSSSPSPRPLFLPDANCAHEPWKSRPGGPRPCTTSLCVCGVWGGGGRRGDHVVTIINKLKENQNMHNHHVVVVSHILPISQNKCLYGIRTSQV